MFDVAVVGFGPTGAVLAGLLAQAGLSMHVCDRLPGVHEIPRALAMDHAIMRVFQQLGLADAIAPFCEPFTPSEYFGVDGQLIKRLGSVPPPWPLPPEAPYSSTSADSASACFPADHASAPSPYSR